MYSARIVDLINQLKERRVKLPEIHRSKKLCDEMETQVSLSDRGEYKWRN